jgi:adenosine deaminase
MGDIETFHPSRIGHGVRSIEDPELISFMKKEDIHIEVCPTSNIQTNVYDTIADHTADKIYRTGLSMSINTDGRMISPVTLTSEYKTMEQVFGWNKEHFLKCNLEAIKHAFTSDKIKAELTEKIRKGFS